MKSNEEKEEFLSDKTTLVDAVKKINWWEWIPVIGGYLFFARVNFKKINYVKKIRKGLTKYSSKFQLMLTILSSPFLIWTIILIVREGWGFKFPIIFLITIFCLQFLTFYQWQWLFLKGLDKIK